MSFKLGFRKLGRFSNGFEQQFAWGEGVSLRQRMRMSRVSGKECLLSIASVFKKNRRKKVQIMIFEIKVKEVDSFSSKALQPTICRKTFLWCISTFSHKRIIM